MTCEPVQDVYRAFLRTVVRDHVFHDKERNFGRWGRPLGDKEREEIGKGRKIDGRIPYLARTSGKGGWHEDPETAERYARHTNVSLLDHLASVVRGTMTLAWIDLSNAGVPETEIATRLPKIAAAAFLHDLDKILGLKRSDRLAAAQVAEGMARYGIDDFLGEFKQSVDPATMLAAIHAAETTRDGELGPGGAILDRTFKRDLMYVRLADRLDGTFLDTSPKGGVAGVVDGLKGFEAGLRSDALKEWRLVRIDDPHTPFLLEELLAGLSTACKDRHGYPPLLEVHHDGRLLCLIPRDGDEAVIDNALDIATRRIGKGMKMRVAINKRGYVDILDARGSLDDLRNAFLDGMETGEREKFLQISIDLARERTEGVAAMLAHYGIAPRWPNLATAQGRRVPVWSGLDANDEAMKRFHLDACCLAATLGCTDSKDHEDIPDAAIREEELIALLTMHRVPVPEWLSALDAEKSKLDRWTLLAALAAAGAASDQDLRDALLASGGLVQRWLEGDDGARKGLVAKIPDSGSALAAAVTAHYKALMGGCLVRAADETLSGRCHFTNRPVPATAKISIKTALYGVKISAFSGRAGRPESFSAVRQETLAAPIAEAEHRLRSKLFKGGAEGEVPVLVSSPSAAGLFGGLLFDEANDDRSFFDLLRLDRTGGKATYSDVDGMTSRVRIGRYEVMPTRLVSTTNAPGQISFVKMAFECALRIGRPLHIFRGLPMPNPAFVAFDFLPPAIEEALGGRAFRLERIPEKIRLLRGLEAIADRTGFGVDLALAVADPATRFAAACDAFARFKKLPEVDQGKVRVIGEIAKTLIEESKPMATPTDNALVAFGHAVAAVQRMPRRDDGKGVSEICIREALDRVDAMAGLGQTSRDTLVAAVASGIRDHIERRELFAKTYTPQAVGEAAETFVDQVWLGAFKGQSPASRVRRMAIATFSWAFEAEARKRFLERKAEQDRQKTTEKARA